MRHDITVIIPTSPIPSHPSTRIIDATIASVWEQIPGAGIIVTCDGTEGYNVMYEEYIRKLIAENPSIYVVPFSKPVHQSSMLERALEHTFTPLVMYLEHDWAILGGVPWKELSDLILFHDYNYIKLHAGARIHPAHEHLMGARKIWHGREAYACYQDGSAYPAIPVVETCQFSANPHLASTEWYREMYRTYMAGKCDFIENILHGPLAEKRAWDMAVYNPMEGGDMVKVRHLDGRGTNA